MAAIAFTDFPTAILEVSSRKLEGSCGFGKQARPQQGPGVHAMSLAQVEGKPPIQQQAKTLPLRTSPEPLY